MKASVKDILTQPVQNLSIGNSCAVNRNEMRIDFNTYLQ